MDHVPPEDRAPQADVSARGAGARSGAWEEEDAFCAFLPDAYVRTDAYGIIRKANGPASTLLQRPPWALEGKPLAGFVDLERRRALRTLLNDMARTTAPQQWTLALQVADDVVAVAATVAPIRDRSGALTGLRWLLRRAAADDTDGLSGSPTPHADPLRHVTGFAELLARASGLMASSFDYAATLRGVAQLVVPTLADWCLVDLLEPSGRLQRLAVAHGPREAPEARTALATAAPLEAIVEGTGLLLGGAVAHAAVVQPVSSEFLATVAADAVQLAQLARLEASAWLAVPLVARGQLLGVLTAVMTSSGRHYSPPLRGVVEELAHRAALAADNARLYQLSVQAAEAKSQFLATVSHELRTPLTAIVGYTELLRDGVAGEVAPAQQRMLDRVRESSDHLLALVDEVLRYARLEAREEQAHLERVALRTLLDQAAVLVEPLARRKGLAFEVEGPPEPVWLLTDAIKVRQILINLLGNAVKFTSSGGIRLTGALEAADRHGTVRAVRLVVQDSGIGIPADQLGRVFDPFWQAERSATRSYGGTGLGLSVVQQLARLLGGDVSVESEPGVGSRFTVRLPLEEGASAPAPAAAPPCPPPTDDAPRQQLVG